MNKNEKKNKIICKMYEKNHKNTIKTKNEKKTMKNKKQPAMLADTQPVGLSFVKLVGGMNGDHGKWQPRKLPRLLLSTFPSDGDERSRVSSGLLSLMLEPASRQLPDSSQTAPRCPHSQVVPASRQLPDSSRQFPDSSRTAPRWLPDSSPTAPRRLPDSSQTAPTDSS